MVAWGLNGNGQATVPAGLSDVAAISAGLYHSAALRTDGTVVVWGDNEYGQTNVPAGLTGVKAIATGDRHTIALKTDGTAVAWGTDFMGPDASGICDVIDVVAVAAAASHSTFLKSDRTV